MANSNLAGPMVDVEDPYDVEVNGTDSPPSGPVVPRPPPPKPPKRTVQANAALRSDDDPFDPDGNGPLSPPVGPIEPEEPPEPRPHWDRGIDAKRGRLA